MHPFSNPTKRVLLVEDDTDLLDELAEYLRSTQRFVVETKDNGIDAIQYLSAQSRVDIIISDYLMVGKGSDLAKAAMQHGIPVIIITGNHEECVRALKFYSLKVPILKKPFHPGKLEELIDHYTLGTPIKKPPVVAVWWNDMDAETR